MRDDRILVLNVGSSSLKFGLYASGAEPVRELTGKIDRIGVAGTKLTFTAVDAARSGERTLPSASHHRAAAESLVDWLSSEGTLSSVRAVGHRVVHGMAHTEPERLTPALRDELQGIAPLDPDHLPMELALIDLVGRLLPKVPQIACFDTSFHATLPRVARQLAIPRRYEAQGIRRYGFHGLSYAYLMEELVRRTGASEARGRVVLAHLGSGASMAAVLNGKSVDTSMAFTPMSGLPMSTRSGDLDPGVAAYLERIEQLSSSDFLAMASHRSGLLGISETSPDMSDLLDREGTDVRAAEAVALFCYQAKKCVGAYAAALGGLDTLVFAGGIGENASAVRARICDGLGFLGIELDAAHNVAHDEIISSNASRATVRVIRTDEELMIARSVCRLLQSSHIEEPAP
jgi:acetate kinase